MCYGLGNRPGGCWLRVNTKGMKGVGNKIFHFTCIHHKK